MGHAFVYLSMCRHICATYQNKKCPLVPIFLPSFSFQLMNTVRFLLRIVGPGNFYCVARIGSCCVCVSRTVPFPKDKNPLDEWRRGVVYLFPLVGCLGEPCTSYSCNFSSSRALVFHGG